MYGLYETLLIHSLTCKDIKQALAIFKFPAKSKTQALLKPGPAVHQKLIKSVYDASIDDERLLDKVAAVALSASEGPGKLYPWQEPVKPGLPNKILLSPLMASHEMHIIIHAYFRNMQDKFGDLLQKGVMPSSRFYKIEIKLIDTKSITLALVKCESGSLLEAHERIRDVLRHKFKPPLSWDNCTLCTFELSTTSVETYIQSLYDRLRRQKVQRHLEITGASTHQEVPQLPQVPENQEQNSQKPEYLGPSGSGMNGPGQILPRVHPSVPCIPAPILLDPRQVSAVSQGNPRHPNVPWVHNGEITAVRNCWPPVGPHIGRQMTWPEFMIYSSRRTRPANNRRRRGMQRVRRDRR